MHAHAREVLFVGAAHHREQMIDVAVDVAVAQQADEVEGLPARSHARRGLIRPRRALTRRDHVIGVAARGASFATVAPT